MCCKRSIIENLTACSVENGCHFRRASSAAARLTTFVADHTSRPFWRGTGGMISSLRYASSVSLSHRYSIARSSFTTVSLATGYAASMPARSNQPAMRSRFLSSSTASCVASRPAVGSGWKLDMVSSLRRWWNLGIGIRQHFECVADLTDSDLHQSAAGSAWARRCVVQRSLDRVESPMALPALQTPQDESGTQNSPDSHERETAAATGDSGGSGAGWHDSGLN